MSQNINISTADDSVQPRSCRCHEKDSGIPVLDVRPIPHSIRHAAVLGAFDAIRPGCSLELIAPHRPLPLIAQLSAKTAIDVKYLEEAPEICKLRITRLA